LYLTPVFFNLVGKRIYILHIHIALYSGGSTINIIVDQISDSMIILTEFVFETNVSKNNSAYYTQVVFSF